VGEQRLGARRPGSGIEIVSFDLYGVCVVLYGALKYS